MSETVHFEDGGVKITPVTMTVENGTFWSSSNKRTVEPLKAFPLNGVTEIRCVTINTSPLSEVWRKMRDWKWLVFLFLGVSAAVVFLNLPDWLALAPHTEKWKTSLNIGLVLLIVTVIVWGVHVFAETIFELFEGWSAAVILVPLLLIAQFGKHWSYNVFMLCVVVLFVAAVVHCVRQNPKHVSVRSRVILVRDGKEVVCYEDDLGPGGYYQANPSAGGQWMENRVLKLRKNTELRIKQIVQALGAAIGQR